MSTIGRPTRLTAKEMDRDVKFYWKRNVGIMECCSRLNLSSRAVASRYKKWDDILTKREDKLFLETQDKAKNRALASLDTQMTELIAVQQAVNKSVTDITNPTFNEIRADLRAKISWMLFDMADKKASLEMTPTVASRVKQEVKLLIDKYQKQPITEQELDTGK